MKVCVQPNNNIPRLFRDFKKEFRISLTIPNIKFPEFPLTCYNPERFTINTVKQSLKRGPPRVLGDRDQFQSANKRQKLSGKSRQFATATNCMQHNQTNIQFSVFA